MAEIGIVGGSGFYELLEDAEEHTIETPFGPPSDQIVTGSFAGRQVAFVPRHGRGHPIPPHRINYRANLWALKQTGISRVLLPCAVGSLQADLDPGTFVVLDQFVDRTTGRAGTYYDGRFPADHDQAGPVTHVSMADPYCPELRRLAAQELTAMGQPHLDRGTVVVIQGPRFSTRAESRWFSSAGWEVVGMTQVPEVPLARELALCAAGIAMVTDHDAGVEGEVAAVTNREVMEVFAANIAHLKELLGRVIARIPGEPGCRCRFALDDAVMA